jgi:hypothetical protein
MNIPEGVAGICSALGHSGGGDFRSGTAIAEVADKSDTSPGPLQLFESGVAEERSQASDRKRKFFPCNREDAIILLSGLCLSEHFPDGDILLAVDGNGLALLPDGLRASEEELINGGLSERYPLLAEVVSSFAYDSAKGLRFDEIQRLVFRTEDQRTAFRLRPFKEFDTESLEASVEPQLFGLPGDPRFHIRAPGSGEIEKGHLADRLAAGVLNILRLGENWPHSRSAVAGFLGDGEDVRHDGRHLSLSRVLRIALGRGGAQPVDNPELGALIRTFLDSNMASSRELLDALAEAFTSLEHGDPEVEERCGIWIEVAERVLRGQLMLDGRRLSDDKSVPLRGALLGLSIDDLPALGAFLNDPAPAGPEVATAAAFLIGLKTGLVGMQWHEKGVTPNVSSRIASTLLTAVLDESPKGLSPFTAETKEIGGAFFSIVRGPDGEVAQWRVESERPVAQPAGWTMDVAQKGWNITGDPSAPDRCGISLDPELPLKLIRCGTEDVRTYSLRYYLTPSMKLKGVRELKGITGMGGQMWYPGVDKDGRDFLYMDFLFLPSASDGEAFRNSLAVALEKYLKKKRTPPKA